MGLRFPLWPYLVLIHDLALHRAGTHSNLFELRGLRPIDEFIHSFSLDNLFLLGSYVPVMFYTKEGNLDWALAIERNSEALKGIIAALFAMLGLDGEAVVGRLPRSVHRAVLRVLWPAESAVRRLIIIAARGLVVKLMPRLRFRVRCRAGPIGKGGSLPSLLPALRSAEKLHSTTPQKGHAESPAHPFLRRRWGGERVAGAPSRSHSAARWPGGCGTPYPQAPGPQG